jgi:hypothetical protein
LQSNRLAARPKKRHKNRKIAPAGRDAGFHAGKGGDDLSSILSPKAGGGGIRTLPRFFPDGVEKSV